MSADNVARARRWFQEVWNERRHATIHELMHPRAVGHLAHTDIVGPDQWKAANWDTLQGAFSDIRVTVEGAIAEGDQVAVRWSAEMKHTGAGLGVPATGRPVAFKGLTWLRFADGQIVEGWDGWDFTGLLVDVGGAQLHQNLAHMRQA
jgi:predicted ester cyclase